MALLTVANVTYAHGPLRVLDGVSLQLDRGQRVALVGRNGCGKSTLLRMIVGAVVPHQGQVQITRGTRIGMLEQSPTLDGTRTVRREAAQAFAELASLHDQLEQVSHQLAEVSNDTPPQQRLMKQYETLERHIDAAGGYVVDHRIDATLHGLGLGAATFDLPVAALSGGQKARLALAKLLLSEPDVLLLDEPTNHLDIAGRQWLEQFLRQFNGAVLLVSHDRWLLDEVVDRIVELDRGTLSEYPGNYSAFREQQAVRRLEQQRRHDKQQTYIRHQKQYIQRYKTGQRAKEARGRQKKLDRYIRDEMVDAVHETAVMNLKLPPAPPSGEQVLNAADLSKRYDDLTLFENITVSIQRGQRIGVIGPNGCGKSTLVRTLIGQVEPTGGVVRTGSRLSVGYYHQTHEHLRDEESPVDYLKRVTAGLEDQSARDVAGAFLFTDTDQDKPLGVLSGGERARVVLAGLVVGGHNLLVLDEPSNHLDIPSAERLTDALQQYDGTLLLVTHDRMLLQETVDELLIFEPCGRLRHFLGTYRDWVDAQRRAADGSSAPSQPKATGAKAVPPKPATPQPNKTQSRYATLSQAKLEQHIMKLEQKLTVLDGQLADPQLYRNAAKVKQVQTDRNATAAELAPLEAEWLRRAED